ncbi:MAG: CCA tRNA nucleotidyltransferase [Agathobacter sp.]|nr:CCA tRNA nucleotidyltransferase [Agathobacter sp.]
MKIELPIDVKNIIETLEANGYEAFAVGGCVRDTLLLRIPGDWDITTSAKPEEVKALFSHTIDTGIQHGTVTVMKNHIGYEVTTYRIDGEYEDARHPKEVIFTANLVEDLKRRDFTINAMAYNDRAGVVDQFDGIKDLQDKVIRCVGEPRERFSEDALRMLRAVRFAAQLGFSIDEKTKEAIKELAPTLEKVSKERIAVELIKILVSDHPEEIRTAYELGLTAVFLPELDLAMKTEQNTPHHKYTVGEHTIAAMEHIQPDKNLRLIMLLHDLAKPLVLSTDENGRAHFHGHTKLGANMAKEILRRLKFDNATIDLVYRMVKYHDERPPMDNMALVRRYISEVGPDYMPMMIEIKRADVMAQSEYHYKEKMEYIDRLKESYDEVIREKQCVQKKDLSINGKDLIQMGMKPGEEMGALLEQLFDEVLKDPTQNDREKLLEQANKFINPFI